MVATAFADRTVLTIAVSNVLLIIIMSALSHSYVFAIAALSKFYDLIVILHFSILLSFMKTHRIVIL